MENLKTKNNKKATSSSNLPKKGEDLNNSKNFKEDMVKKVSGKKTGKKRIKKRTTKNKSKKQNIKIQIRNGMGFGFGILSIYFFLVLIGIISFTPRFAILGDKLFILVLAIVFLILGVLLNDQFKGIFKK